MSIELIMKTRERVEQCRRLAKSINDTRTTEALLAMAIEIEADLKKLEAADGNGPTRTAGSCTAAILDRCAVRASLTSPQARPRRG
jgi:hypothetical protein